MKVGGIENEPQVVAIILTVNQKKDTLKCLASLEKQYYSKLETVLVDNGSTDGTAQQVERQYPDVSVLKLPRNKGAADGRNKGIGYANSRFEYDYLLFLDNDTEVDAHFLKELVISLENNLECGLAASKIYQMDKRLIFDIAGGDYINYFVGSVSTRGNGEEDKGQYDNNLTPEIIPPTGCLLVRRKVLDEVGSFDVGFDPYGYEDLDFSIRSINAGFKFCFSPNSIIYHKGNKTGYSGYTVEYAFAKGRNLRRFLRKNASVFQRTVFRLFFPMIVMRAILKPLFGGSFSASISFVKGLLRG